MLGLTHIGDAPRIFQAFNPWLGLRFLFGHGFYGFIVLGSYRGYMFCCKMMRRNGFRL